MTDDKDLMPLEDEAASTIRRVLNQRANAVEPPERLAELLTAANRTEARGPRRRRFRWVLSAAVAALLVGLALPVLVPQLSLLGRPEVPMSSTTANQTVSSNAPPSLPTMQRDLPIYYVGADRRLYREFRDLPTQDDRLATAVGAVLNVAPQDSSYSSLWAGGQVNSATVTGSRIVIDISAPAFATFTTRAVAEAAINQVVYTAIGTIGDQTGERTVQILIDGSPNLPVIGAPAADFRKNGTAPLGLLWILTPEPVVPVAPGEVRIRGYQQVVLADTTIAWQVLDAEEKVVRQGTVAATGNEAGWRSFLATVVLPPGEYELRVRSAQAPEQRRHFTVRG
ncbi:GerMN domain-containing protein [Tessaracoccus sp. SD287]|uniref:Gmad2 immunoglobulin-like domain-containing protein n=1 Tax=Tessaracoccus sp. SD287 TaxID=2782008 RepID=UPI001A9646B6|nr:GerMN domain-containing protein [Tessaracoccus sp. SD287]MBO1031782.1 GerMN domain-containing protein [Tessaracoccus sp. SD287]